MDVSVSSSSDTTLVTLATTVVTTVVLPSLFVVVRTWVVWAEDSEELGLITPLEDVALSLMPGFVLSGSCPVISKLAAELLCGMVPELALSISKLSSLEVEYDTEPRSMMLEGIEKSMNILSPSRLGQRDGGAQIHCGLRVGESEGGIVVALCSFFQDLVAVDRPDGKADVVGAAWSMGKRIGHVDGVVGQIGERAVHRGPVVVEMVVLVDKDPVVLAFCADSKRREVRRNVDLENACGVSLVAAGDDVHGVERGQEAKVCADKVIYTHVCSAGGCFGSIGHLPVAENDVCRVEVVAVEYPVVSLVHFNGERAVARRDESDGERMVESDRSGERMAEEDRSVDGDDAVCDGGGSDTEAVDGTDTVAADDGGDVDHGGVCGERVCDEDDRDVATRESVSVGAPGGGGADGESGISGSDGGVCEETVGGGGI
ncbi:hypothetical protein OGATHE_006071 [Ogataea polymorpha]|uniref:Uncharacterized protein n=1 Tax=Ogataea polymorpha TaxID=460523 RepID=A0A9P8NSP2_9ASCO|nr:hypothetical protein OGATHE_006071 [Ogataea polymorpha]